MTHSLSSLFYIQYRTVRIRLSVLLTCCCCCLSFVRVRLDYGNGGQRFVGALQHLHLPLLSVQLAGLVHSGRVRRRTGNKGVSAR
jgi:hypothetical protein